MTGSRMILGLCIVGTLSLFGQGLKPAEAAARREEWRRLPAEERQRRVYRATGGFIDARNSRLGKVSIVNTQEKVGEDVVQSAARRLSLDSRLNFEYLKAAPAAPEKILADTKAAAVVIVVDDPDRPVALVALEDRWAIVNVAKIGRGLKSEDARKRFVPSRTYKEIGRCACILCGGARSQFQGNILDVGRLEDLDLIENGGVPMDRVSAMVLHLRNFGVTQERKVPYKRAVQEGWAPAPTNDVQKAIWEKVRTEKERGPSKPITIPPPKK